MNIIKLNNGVEMPQQGLGTYLIPQDKLSWTIGRAYELGYRQFDTAWRYHNEKDVAKALKDNHINREDVFITSKYNVVANHKSLWWHGKNIFNIKTRSVKSVIEESFRDLNTDYIDLYLLHFPYPMYKEIWEAMIEFYQQGRIRAIGVCSCLPPHIEAIRAFSGIIPAVNQFEISPLNCQKQLIDYCHNIGVAVEAMSTFSHYRSVAPRPEIMQDSNLISIANKYNKSVVQVVLRWLFQQNIILIPKTWDLEHLKQNIEITDFELSSTDMKLIDSLDGGKFLNYNPYNATKGYKKFFKSWEGFK